MEDFLIKMNPTMLSISRYIKISFLFISISLSSAFFCVQAKDVSFADECLNYVISYKWGIIHKDSGDATLRLRNTGDRFVMTLSGKTKSWADRFYQVRDTLIAEVDKNGFRPRSYIKIAHEDGKYSRDEIDYSYSGKTVGGHCTRTKVSKKGETTVTQKDFTSTGPTFDMLSVFYYLRTIDYDKLTSGNALKSTLFSGSKVETLTVRCEGRETLKMRNGSSRESYKIKFNFTTEGKKKSSDDLTAWISTDNRHIPLQIVGSLPLGQVKCYYMGN